MRKPRGHVRLHGTGFQAIVSIELGLITRRYRCRYAQAGTEEGAEGPAAGILAS
jgi:hypothetical protein